MAQFLIEIYKGYHGKSAIFSESEIQSILGEERDGHVYGFIINRSEDDIAITHYSGNIGYRTGMTISLLSGNGLVYLINSDNGAALGNELLLSVSAVYNWSHFQQVDAQRKVVPADMLKTLPGNYKWNNQIDLSITYDESNSRISLHFPNGDEYKLVAIVGEKDQLEFIHPNTAVRLAFLEKDEFQSFILYGNTAVKLKTQD